jgi:hypothetical protein
MVCTDFFWLKMLIHEVQYLLDLMEPSLADLGFNGQNSGAGLFSSAGPVQ